MSKIIILCV